MSGLTSESVFKAARAVNIKLPKTKKESLAVIGDVLAGATGDDKGPCDENDVVQMLRELLGTKEAAGGKGGKVAGKRKAQAPPADEKVEEAKPSSSSVLDEAWDISDKAKKNACATKIVDVAKSRGVKMPEEEKAARMGAFAALMGLKGEAGTVKVKDAVEFLEDKYGKDPDWVDPDSKSAKKKRPSKAKQCVCPENTELADAFDELAGLYFKEQSKAGFVYKKVVSAIKDLPAPVEVAPKKGEIKGVGAKTIAKIKEFLETGKIQELEEKRAESLA